MEGRIEWMHVSDALKRRAMPAIENDIACALWLITIAWKNDSNFIVGGIRRIIAATIRGLIKVQSYLALLLQRHVSGELISLLVHLNCRMAAVDHVLEDDQSVVIKLCIPCIGHPKINGISWIVDVQLSIYGRFPFRWKKRADLVR